MVVVIKGIIKGTSAQLRCFKGSSSPCDSCVGFLSCYPLHMHLMINNRAPPRAHRVKVPPDYLFLRCHVLHASAIMRITLPQLHSRPSKRLCTLPHCALTFCSGKVVFAPFKADSVGVLDVAAQGGRGVLSMVPVGFTSTQGKYAGAAAHASKVRRASLILMLLVDEAIRRAQLLHSRVQGWGWGYSSGSG